MLKPTLIKSRINPVNVQRPRQNHPYPTTNPFSVISVPQEPLQETDPGTLALLIETYVSISSDSTRHSTITLYCLTTAFSSIKWKQSWTLIYHEKSFRELTEHAITQQYYSKLSSRKKVSPVNPNRRWNCISSHLRKKLLLLSYYLEQIQPLQNL